MSSFNSMTWRIVAPLLVAAEVGGLSACATARPLPDAKTIEGVIGEVPDPKMRELWRKADAEGRLPPFAAIPTPDRRVARRTPVDVREPPVAEAKGPVLPRGVVADTQVHLAGAPPFQERTFLVTRSDPGLLSGTLLPGGEQMEIHYRLPGERQQLAILERSKLMLTSRESIRDASLQKQLVVRGEDGRVVLVHVAEGSEKPYRQVIESVGIVIEQQPGEKENPVAVTYRTSTTTLKPGERRLVGEGSDVVEAFLLDSIATTAQQARLQEGQPYYVNVLVYRVR